MSDRRFVWPAIVVAAVALGAAIPALELAAGIGQAGHGAVRLEPHTYSWGVDWTSRAAGATAIGAAAAMRLARLVAGAGVVALIIAALTLWAIGAIHSDARRAEWTIHRALGASRRLLVLQGLREGATVAAAALIGGAAIAAVGATIMSVTWSGTPAWNVTPGGATLTAAISITLWMTWLAVAPLLALRSKPRLASAPLTRRGRLVPAMQLGVALAVLLAAARLAGPRPFGAAHVSDDPGGVAYPIAVSEKRTADERAAIYGSLLDTLADDPSVGSVGVASPGMLLGHGPMDLAVTDCGACWQGGLPAPFHPVAARYHLVSPDTFEAAGIPIVAGRAVHRNESGSDPVAIVSQALAQRHFERGGAVGRRIRVGKSPGKWHLVIGVAQDRQPHGLATTASPYAVYLSALQHPATDLELLVSAQSDGSAVRRALASVLGPDAVAREPTTFVALRRAAARPGRWLAVALGIEGAIALLLATCGVALIGALTADRRRTEYAVRRAVGARRRDIRRLVYGETALIVLFGLGIGWWLDLLAAGVVSSAAGSGSLTAPAWLGLAGLLAASAFAGALGPAQRAATVMPAAALEPGTA